MRSVHACVFFAILLLATSAPPAGAYSIAGNNPPNLLENFAAPFQSFIESINSTRPFGGIAIPAGPGRFGPSVSPQAGFLIQDIQNLFRMFDNWLYNIAGFHILVFFAATLNIFSWLLGAVKGAVDWLLGLIRG